MFCCHNKSQLLLWLACASLADALAAAEVKPSTSANAEQAYRITRWTSEDGLPANRITALSQTRDGYLWAGTWFGLVRFDGVRFTVFNRYNTPAMVNDAVNALAEDSEGNLWIGTADGLVVLRDGRFKRFTETDRLPDRKVWRLVPGRGGGLWMRAGDGKVAYWAEGRPTMMLDLQLVMGTSVRSIWENDDGSLTVVTTFGLRRVSRLGEVVEEPCPPGVVAKSWIGGCLIDRQKRYWLSSEVRLSQFSKGAWHVVQETTDGTDSGHFLYEDRSGCVWVNRGKAGFWRCDGDRVEPVRLDERSDAQLVTCMMEDREGHLWVGTPDGLYQLRSKLIRAFSTTDGLPSDECWSVCEAPDGAIWVETKAGVARIEKEHAQTIADQPGRPTRMSILMDSRGALWLGNGSDGVITWRRGAETNWYWSTGWRGVASGCALESLYLDRAGRVWVGTSYGVTWFENGQPASHWGEFGLPTNGVRSIYQTRDGTMWFGNWEDGAVRWKGNTKSEVRPVLRSSTAEGGNPKSEINQSLLTSAATRFTTADGLADNRVFVFHEDAEGSLWIGTHNGLNRFKEGRFFTFSTKHGLLDNLINWLEEDDFGRLWFSCNRGIFRIDRSELNAVADGKKARANVAVYGTADGMLSPETNGEHQPAGCKDREGRLWFPTTQGVVVIDPRNIKDNEVPPLVVIEEVRADGQVVGGDLLQDKNPKSEIRSPQLKLAPGRARTLQISYTANSFADPRRVRFRYRLDGQDHDWRDAADERMAFYTDLKPGRYRFEVTAANPHGVWSESVGAFAFSIAPHFWQTWPFYVVSVLGTILLAVWLAVTVENYRLRWQRQLLKSEERQALADERTRIARDLHDDLGTALTGLALELDVIRGETKSAPPAQERLGATAKRTRNLAERMREVVWAVNPRCDTVSSLASFLEQETAQFLRSDGLRGRFEFPDDIPALPLDSAARHQLALSVREALTNVVRHAHATEVFVSLVIEERTLVVQVADNGRGFRLDQLPRNCHGLASVRERLERIGGRAEWVSAPDHGTTVSFRLPLKEPPASNAEKKA